MKAQYETHYAISSLNLVEIAEQWGPHIDGKIVKSQATRAFARGDFSRKPFIIGTTTEEARPFVYLAFGKPLHNSLYYLSIASVFPRHIFQVLKAYPANDTRDERDNLGNLATDFLFICPARNIIRNAVEHVFSDVWLYVFDHALSRWGNFTPCIGHVCHSADIPFVFQAADRTGYKYTREEIVLSKRLMEYWTNFAKYGNPNGLSKNQILNYNERWPKYTSANRWTALKFACPQLSMINNFKGKTCDLWDEIGY